MEFLYLKKLKISITLDLIIIKNISKATPSHTLIGENTMKEKTMTPDKADNI